MPVRFRNLQVVLALVAIACCSGDSRAEARAPDAAAATTLTNATQIRALTQSAAAAHLPVHLQGIVIGEAEPAGKGFAVLDATGGIYVESAIATVAQLHPGDCVTINGVTDPGSYAPFVAARDVTKTGNKPLPEPRQVTYEELASGELDAQWVEVRGVVRFCEPSWNDSRKCRLEVATGGGRLIVRWNRANMRTPMVDAEVRLRGVCYYLVNHNRQFLSPMLAIPGEVPVITEAPPPSEPFSAPVRSVSSLMQFTPEGSYGHRVHVRGVVIGQQPGETLWVRDGDRGVRVQSSQAGEIHPGDVVDALGFPVQSDYSPILEDAIYRVGTSPGLSPNPLALTTAQDAFDHDADLVELEAKVGDREFTAAGWTFKLETAEGTRFNAVMRAPAGQPPPKDSLPGSRVHIAGVCTVFRDHAGLVSGLSRPRAFQLLMRSTSDLSLIAPPPWLTRQRITWILCGIAGVSLLGVAGVVIAARLRLREQVLQRTRAEAEFSAILRERNRLAREIHDILAQGLSAIVLHLDLAKDEFQHDSQRTAKHLGIALGVARNSMADASTAVWNLRSQVLENNNLPSALESVLKQLTDGTQVSAQFELSGQVRRLPPVTENAILRIGQEAITNATKHAVARFIGVKLEFGEKRILLNVRDDGRGFNASEPSPRAGGFGLAGIRERAAQLGGVLTVCSQPGSGTEINLSVPVTA